MEKHFAVIGDPIAHSLSPCMHNAGYQAARLAAEYQRFAVKPEQLREAVLGLRALGFSGWNVTIPHKEKIIPFLDELTPTAERAGAVNTVKVTETGKLIGHNTDGWGFLRSISALLPVVRGKNVVLLGAGGAARGIAVPLAESGAKLLILNRTPEKAGELSELLTGYGAQSAWGSLQPGDWLAAADLVVQTTSVGLRGEPFSFSLRGLKKEALVVDIIFNPAETQFLREARQLGNAALNGLGMLLYQGVLAWEFWLEEPPPVENMEQALRAADGG
ncbi:MAG: shikimate dehydrogenase [Peptococcaceae bacterium]|jgi:shikimate dehydrogenase|nr:shikimate dehydrogenase [Peptococcaceae bacterium]